MSLPNCENLKTRLVGEKCRAKNADNPSSETKHWNIILQAQEEGRPKNVNDVDMTTTNPKAHAKNALPTPAHPSRKIQCFPDGG